MHEWSTTVLLIPRRRRRRRRPRYVDAILRNGFDDIETLAEMREEAAKREVGCRKGRVPPISPPI